MSRESKTNWKPAISLEILQQRSKTLQKIRAFFFEKGLIEVETPLMSQTAVTDPHIDAITAQSSRLEQPYYLQTSPEYAMKRLLAAGSGSIFQICKAFRDNEIGKKHNPEFTMLEWYRIDWTHKDLAEEVDRFLQYILNCQPAITYTYEKIFEQTLHLNPHMANLNNLQACATRHGIALSHNAAQDMQLHDWLDLLFSHLIEPKLTGPSPWIIINYPRSHCALAKLATHSQKITVAERFEVFMNGIELANGYHELTDADEQYLRFQNDVKIRKKLNKPSIPIDKQLLAALPHLPNCAGVALGIDRLMQILFNQPDISHVLTFPTQPG